MVLVVLNVIQWVTRPDAAAARQDNQAGRAEAAAGDSWAQLLPREADAQTKLEFDRRLVAAIVVPQCIEASNDARENQLRSDLQAVPSQLELYEVQDLERYPAGRQGEDRGWLIARMTRRTNAEGQCGPGADPEPALGPYLIGFPANPFASANADKVEVGRNQNADGDPGWFFNPETGEFLANTAAHPGL